MDGARDISAVICVKIQIGGNFLVERLQFQLFTMASAHFATFSTQEIEKIEQNKDSENTKKSTKILSLLSDSQDENLLNRHIFSVNFASLNQHA